MHTRPIALLGLLLALLVAAPAAAAPAATAPALTVEAVGTTTADAPMTREAGTAADSLLSSALLSSSCPKRYSATTTLEVKGGATNAVLGTARLKSYICTNSTNTKILSNSYDAITCSRTLYGSAIGFTWADCPDLDVREWVTNPTKYRHRAQGESKMCTLIETKLTCGTYRYPWIQHDMTAKGTVTRTSGW